MHCRGSWTVDCIGQVERALGELALPARVPVELDASGAEAMDTAGAWLPEALPVHSRELVVAIRDVHTRPGTSWSTTA